MKAEEASIGMPVHYNPFHGVKQNGIIKSEVKDNDTVFVVYSADGDWDNYQKYTGVATALKDLVPGWIIAQGNVGRIQYMTEAYSKQPITMNVTTYSEEDIKKLSNYQRMHSIKKIILEEIVVGLKSYMFYCGYNYYEQRVFQFHHKSVNIGYFPNPT
jgi:hypothetical protein